MESGYTNNKQSLMEQMASILIDLLEERSPAWQRSEGKNPAGQLASMRRALDTKGKKK